MGYPAFMTEPKKGGSLYLVATPIGNMGDITQRALEVLGRVSLIAAEDTRVTGRLLALHGISGRLVSFFEHNETARTERILGLLAEGSDAALVTNAGTPAVSDPGYRLVREAAAAGFDVVPVPGACAAIAALSASGLPTDRFAFEGFLPRKGRARSERIDAIARYRGTVILYESPLRLEVTLEDLMSVLGDAPCVVAREMTKTHEEFVRGNLSHALARFRAVAARGEATILIDTRGLAESSVEEARSDAEKACRELMAQGVLKDREIAQDLARRFKISRSEAYRLVLSIKKDLIGDESVEDEEVDQPKV